MGLRRSEVIKSVFGIKLAAPHKNPCGVAVSVVYKCPNLIPN
jgi:hypothetical protein